MLISREKNQQPLEIGWSFRLFDSHHWFSRELRHLDQSERTPMTRVFKYPKGKVTKRRKGRDRNFERKRAVKEKAVGFLFFPNGQTADAGNRDR